MSLYKIINWKIIKNRNLAKIVNMVCYETQEKKQAGLLWDYIDKDLWLKINANDYQEIKKGENDHLLPENGRGIYQNVIDYRKQTIEGIDFDFSPWRGKEIIFSANLVERHGLSLYKIGTFKRLESDNVRVIGLTSRQQEADLRKVSREQIQQEWENEKLRETKLIMISDLRKQLSRHERNREVELGFSSAEGAFELENEEQIEQVEIPPKRY